MIIKPVLENNFFVGSNHILRDKNLSDKAKLLAFYLSSLPSDWEVYVSDIAKKLQWSLRKTQYAFKELVELDYIQKIQIQDKKSGRFTKAFNVIFTSKIDEIEQNEAEKEELKLIIKNELKYP